MTPAFYPRKRFGQNFLRDKNIINHIIATINPQPGQHLIEIGPGEGALTYPILKMIGKLDVIEIDRDLIPTLKKQGAQLGELIVHEADVLRFEFSSFASTQYPIRVFGNLPYNISTPLLFHLIKFLNVIQDMHFMLQKEVVLRMAAKPGSSDYGRLSVMLQYHCHITPLFTVPASAFWPKPKVESMIVRLVPHSILPYPTDDYLHFSEIVQKGFSQRRKMLRHSLKGLVSEQQLIAAGIDPQQRPETLSVADFVKLSNNPGRAVSF